MRLCPGSFAIGALLALSPALPGCPGPGGPNAPKPAMQPAAAFSRPEPDPSCRVTVREPLRSNGLDQVVVRVGVDPGGKLTLLELLAPDLAPAAKEDLRRAFAKCRWKPGLGAEGEPEPGWTTLVFDAKPR